MAAKARLTAANVRWIHKNAGKLSVREMARRLNCSAAYVSDILTGKRQPRVMLAAIRAVPIQWEHKCHGATTSQRCWNNRFWYADGTCATIDAVIISRADYKALRRAALNGRENP